MAHGRLNSLAIWPHAHLRCKHRSTTGRTHGIRWAAIHPRARHLRCPSRVGTGFRLLPPVPALAAATSCIGFGEPPASRSFGTSCRSTFAASTRHTSDALQVSCSTRKICGAACAWLQHRHPGVGLYPAASRVSRLRATAELTGQARLPDRCKHRRVPTRAASVLEALTLIKTTVARSSADPSSLHIVHPARAW